MHHHTIVIHASHPDHSGHETHHEDHISDVAETAVAAAKEAGYVDVHHTVHHHTKK